MAHPLARPLFSTPFNAALVAAAVATGLTACGGEVNVTSQSTGAGTGGAGASSGGAGASSGTSPDGGAGFGGAGGFGDAVGSGGGEPAITCSPAPPLDGEVAPAIPADVTADMAGAGSWSRVAVGPDGDAIVVGGSSYMLIARRYQDGSWADLERLVALPAGNGSTFYSSVALAAGPGGQALLLYGEHYGSNIVMCSRLFDPATGWSPPEQHGIADEGWWQDPVAPRVGAAMNAAGNAVVMWTGNPDGSEGLSVRRYSAAAGWSEAQFLTKTSALAPTLSLRDDDSSLVVWDNPFGSALDAAFSASSGAGWGQAEEVSPAGIYPQLSPGPNGSTLALWARYSNGDYYLDTAIRSSSGEWSAPEQLTSTADTGWQPQLATGASGAGLGAWETSTATCAIDSRVWIRSENGAFQEVAPVPVLDDSPALINRLAASDAGQAAAAWQRLGDSTCDFQEAHLSWLDMAAGSWHHEALDLSDKAHNPEVALSPDGRALCSWSRKDGSFFARWVALAPP